MQGLFKHIKEMEAKLHSLMAEMQELKHEIREVDEENSRLRNELAAFYRADLVNGTVTEAEDKSSAAFSNLLELYDQNFHICNLYFGRRRAGECLFCMAFLRKETEPSTSIKVEEKN
ncbi:MAG: initiation control protein YabA [Desulfotomaculaceae bacterium]|nr:initiation control protein YabA [Desulfotomaculaceae bacterium]